MEQYINQRAKDFVEKFMLREPVDYYEEILKTMKANGKLQADTDLRIAAEELNYSFLGIIFELYKICLSNPFTDLCYLDYLCGETIYISVYSPQII